MAALRNVRSGRAGTREACVSSRNRRRLLARRRDDESRTLSNGIRALAHTRVRGFGSGNALECSSILVRGARREACPTMRCLPPNSSAAGLGVFSCRLEVSMRRRSGDVVEVLVVNALRRSRFRSVAQLAPHESGIIASLTAFVVCCLLLFRFSVFFFFASSWCSCHRTCTSGKKLFLDRIASTVLVDVPPFQMKLNVSLV